MINRLPLWFKQEIPDKAAQDMTQLLLRLEVNTVCQKAKCPNLAACFKKRELTFMILGDNCTRNCRFCAVSKARDKILGIDLQEAERISRIVSKLQLNYVVITSVARDDLIDGGAGQFVKTIKSIQTVKKNVKIEVLIPDFLAKLSCLKKVVNASPAVIAHNLETVKRLSKELRPQADYNRSLSVLKKIKLIQPDMVTKSSLILGLGETEKEVLDAMGDLRSAKCDILTLGQYLAPSGSHYSVKEFIALKKFAQYKEIAASMGFKAVLSSPLARSSYSAYDLYRSVS